MCAAIGVKFALPLLDIEDEVKHASSSYPLERPTTKRALGGEDSGGDDERIVRIPDDDDDNEDGTGQTAFPKLSSPLSRPVTLDEYRDGSYEKGVDREWTELWKLCDKKAFAEVGYEPPKSVHKTRNRFKDILPNKQTRVKLIRSPHPEVNCDYINANFVRDQMYNSERTYIAAQAPTDTSIEEFWVMVWEQSVSLIIMLTKEEEDGVTKSSKYWPDATRESIDIDVELSMRFDGAQLIPQDSVIVRKFIISNKETSEERLITHFQYVGWPDKDVPQDMTEFRRVLEHYRSYRDVLEMQSPIVLHCSAGVGRTGTFIALDIIMDHLQRFRAKNKSGVIEPSINVAALVFELRKQRRNMIQNKAQYRFICDFIAYCSRTNEFLDVAPSIVSASYSLASTRDRTSVSKRNSRPLYSTRSSAQSFFGNSSFGGSGAGLTIEDDQVGEEVGIHANSGGAPTMSRNSGPKQFFQR
eukprot:TRINITY_DN6524_c0_g2_i1.p1 TRINITY_DN6524_c0_g2~~TRINITY_DN6524_c0_g2_i1.p1  ORF type:complete len:470 (+),score=99.59 TRINITY_DN6524_c0_g2_i1:1563-2972(+)